MARPEDPRQPRPPQPSVPDALAGAPDLPPGAPWEPAGACPAPRPVPVVPTWAPAGVCPAPRPVPVVPTCPTCGRAYDLWALPVSAALDWVDVLQADLAGVRRAEAHLARLQAALEAALP